MSGDDRLDLGDGRRARRAARGIHGIEDLERERAVDRSLREGVECDDPDEGTLERADVVDHAVGDEVKDGRVGQHDVCTEDPK